VETEIAYVIATDIGAQLTVPRQALTTIQAVMPVIELPEVASWVSESPTWSRSMLAPPASSSAHL
jgi:2-keto-4-pentenoate hydratase